MDKAKVSNKTAFFEMSMIYFFGGGGGQSGLMERFLVNLIC